MADGSIIIETSVDVNGLKNGISGLNSVANTAFKGIATALGSITTAASAAAGFMIKVGSDFEAGMSRVQAISGASGGDLEKLTEKAKEMGATTKFSATEAASAMEFMAMAGWKTEDMLGGISGIMDLAAASGESLALTSDIVTDALTGFGLTAADSGRFADVLAAASSNANTNVAMMGETFKYVAPVAGALGYSVEDTSVAIGLMANSGIKASQAGTSLRGMLTNLAKPTGTIKDYMDELDLSLTDVNGEIKPLNALLLEMREKFDGLTEAQKAQYAAGIAGKEAMSGLLAIVNASDADFKKLTEAIANSNGAAARMAETMQNNLKGSLTILGSTVEGLGISFYDNIKGSATDAVKSLTGTLSSHEFKASFDTFSKGSAKIIDGLSGLSKKALPAAAKGFAFFAENLREIVGITGAVYLGLKSFSVLSSVTAMVQGTTTALAAYTAVGSAVTVQQAAMNGALSLGQIAVGALTGQISLATAAQAAWNIVLSANPVGLIVAGVGALTVGLTAYAVLTKESATETQRLCDESEALLQTSQGLRSAMQDSAQKRKEEKREMEKQAGTAKILADRLSDLADKTNKTAGEKEQMLSLVEQLNEAIPGLNLAYDAENDVLNKQRDEIHGVIDANLELLKVKAAQEDQTKIAQEAYDTEKNLNDLRQQRLEIVYQLMQMESDLYAITQDADKAFLAQDARLSYEYKSGKLVEQLASVNAEIQSLESEAKGLNREFDECGQYIRNVADSANDSADSLDAMGQAGAAAGEQVAQSVESLAKALGLTEEQVKTVQEHLEDYEATATNVFSKIADESGHSIQEMIANLEANQQAVNEWADNLVAAAVAGVDQGLLLTLQEAGPEAAGYVKALVDASDVEIARLNEVFRNGTEAARNASNAELTIMKRDSLLLVGEAVDGMAGKLRDGTPDIVGATVSMCNSAVNAISPLAAAFREVGERAAEGLRAAITGRTREMIDSVRGVVDAVVNGTRAHLEVNSPSKLTMRKIGVPFMEGIGKGIEKTLPDVERQMGAGLEDMAGKMEAAVAMESSVIGANTAARQYSSTTSSTVNLGGIRNQIEYYGGSPADADTLMRRMGQKTRQALRAKGVPSFA